MALDFQKALVNEAIYLTEKRELFPSKNFKYAILKSDTIQEKTFF